MATSHLEFGTYAHLTTYDFNGNLEEFWDENYDPATDPYDRFEQTTDANKPNKPNKPQVDVKLVGYA